MTILPLYSAFIQLAARVLDWWASLVGSPVPEFDRASCQEYMWTEYGKMDKGKRTEYGTNYTVEQIDAAYKQALAHLKVERTIDEYLEHLTSER
jgi:hypothetical protein